MARHRLPVCAILAACSAPAAPRPVEPPRPTSPEAKPVDKTLAETLAEVRAKRAAGDDHGADAALAQAIAIAKRDGGAPVTTIDEAPGPLHRQLLASPDGTRWAAVLDERVQIHDVATGLLVSSIVVHTGGVHVALLDGGKLAVADFHGVRVLDATGKVEKVLREFAPGAIHDAAVFAGDGGRVAIADDRSVEIMTVDGKSVVKADRPSGGHKPWLEWGAWHGRTLAFSDHDRIEVWRAASDLAHVQTMTGIDAIELSWDGRQLVVSHDNAVHVVDTVGNERATAPAYNAQHVGFIGDVPVAALPGEIDRVDATALVKIAEGHGISAMTEVGDRLVTDNGTLSRDAGGIAFDASPFPGEPINALTWGADRLVALTAGNGFVLTTNGVAVSTVSVSIHTGDRAVFKPGTPELWWLDVEVPSYGGQATLVSWNTTKGEPSSPYASRIAAFSHDGARRLVQPAPDKPLEIREGDQVAQVVQIRDPFDLANPMPVDRGGFADGDRVLVLGGSGHTIVWSLKLKVITWSKDEPLIDVSPDGRIVVTRTPSGLRATDLGTQRELGALELPVGVYIPHDDRAAQLAATAFSPDGATLAIGTQRGTIELVDVATWKIVKTIDAHTTDVSALAWRPDGKLLASGSRGGVIELWAPDGSPRATIALGNAANDWLAQFPDGSVAGQGRRHLALRVGAHPLGLGLATAPAAPASAWAALF